jgi:hypothetical protein
MIKLKCKKCGSYYEFKRCSSKNDFVCRTCKIKQKTQSEEFKTRAKIRSLAKLQDKDIKEKMSIKASLNNVENAEKISESLKKHFKDNGTSKISKALKERWQDPDYKKKMSETSKDNWQSTEYRSKVINSLIMSDLRKSLNDKDHQQIKEWLELQEYEFEENHFLGYYDFNFIIDGWIILDLKSDNERKLFIEHYFSEYKYITEVDDL